MKFADKYELSEAVTCGRLETFMGRDIGSGEPVLVHIFDAPVKKPDQPTVLWVLESFRAVAPEPPGLVLATGKYGGTSYAYLVTQVPDDAALRKWKQTYESSTAETREIPIDRSISERSVPADPPAVSTVSTHSEAETVVPASSSQLNHPPTGFFEMRPPSETAAKSPKNAAEIPGVDAEDRGNDLDGIIIGTRTASRQEPGDFTKQFFNGSTEPRPANEALFHSATQRMDGSQSAADAIAGTGAPFRSVDSAPPDLGGFTALFRPSFKPEIRQTPESPQRIDAAGKVDDGKAGDFTKFFQGPFDGERPAEIPDALRPNVSSAPRGKTPGEFTQMFGAAKDSPFDAMSSSSSPAVEPPLRTDAGTFTQSFGQIGQVARPTEPLSPTGQAKENGSAKAPTFPEPKWTEPVLSPVEPHVKPPDPPAISQVSGGPRIERRPSVQDGATQLFTVPGGHSAPNLDPLPPSGPSEYTRIIQSVKLIPSEEKPAAEEGPTAAASGLPAFKMPAPPVPPAPKIAPPAAPKLPAAPAAPKVPPVGALVPKPKPSYLPMIIVLNVSLIIAVLLIVYFAIKH
jgi:hypothetical protein